jgi:hypothetical protein
MLPSGWKETTAPPSFEGPASSRAFRPMRRPFASISLQSSDWSVTVRPRVSR